MDIAYTEVLFLVLILGLTIAYINLHRKYHNTKKKLKEKSLIMAEHNHEINHLSSLTGKANSRNISPLKYASIGGAEENILQNNNDILLDDILLDLPELTILNDHFHNDEEQLEQDNRRLVDKTNFLQQQIIDKTEEIQTIRDRLGLIFNCVPDAILGLDTDGNVEFINNRAVSLFGYSEEELIGMNTHNLLHSCEKEKLHISACNICRAMTDENTVTVQNQVVWCKNGSALFVNAIITPLCKEEDVIGFVHFFQDTSEVRTVKQNLANQRTQLQTIIDTSPVGLFLSRNNNILMLNPRAKEIVNIQSGNSERGAFAHLEDYETIIHNVQTNGHISDYELEMLSPSGSICNVLLSALSASWNGEQGTLFWLVDITSLKKAEQELFEAMEKANEATRTKSSFLAKMSHEIRTPMNAIIGMSYLCQQTELSERQKDYMHKLDAAANNLLQIINNILNFSNMKEEELTLNEVNFSMSSMLENMRKIADPICANKNLKLVLDWDENVPDQLYGDQARLMQILHCLANNAVKFTEHGTVGLAIKLVDKKEDQVFIKFTVHDTGIGISEEHLTKLFQSFTQADDSLTRKYGGAGLGLALSKRLVELMNGKIWAESQLGKGSSFNFIIPYKISEQKDKEVMIQQPIPACYLNKPYTPRVLLVEDNEINQEIALELLKNVKVEVTIAENGLQAVQLATTEQFDLIFMDIQMPIMDGLEAVKRIRASDKPHAVSVPIVAMTAHATEGDHEKSLAVGMNDHLTKPLVPSALYKVVNQWLYCQEAENNASGDLDLEKNISIPKIKKKSEQVLESKWDILHGITVFSGLANVAGNEKLYLDLLKRFATKYENSHLELPEFLHSNDIETAARLAHTVKGVAANLGAMNLANLAKNIETHIAANESIDETLQNYKKELFMVVNSIKQLSNQEPGDQQIHDGHDKLNPEEIAELTEILKRLPSTMELDWGQAQADLGALNKKLMNTEAATDFYKLQDALEGFDLEAVIEESAKVLRHFE